MRSTDLTREQLERIERHVDKHLRYYVQMWKRAQANDMPLDDPLVQGICEAWNALNNFMQKLERMKSQLPQPYRPLVAPTKNSGLSMVEMPWAEKQRRMAEEYKAAQKPQPPWTL